MAPPPPVGAPEAWPPPPAGFPQQRFTAPLPELTTGQVGEGEDDPWASWYGRPRNPQADSPSATLPRVTGAVPAAPGPQAPPGGPPPWHQPQPYGAAPPYGPPQYTGAMPYAEQPPYGGPQQYGGLQQYGEQPYGGPAGPGAPGRPPGRKSRGPLVPALAIGAIAVAAIVALLLATRSSGSPSASTAASGATGASSASSTAAQGQAASALAGLLAQSGNDHSAVNAAVGNVEACKSLRDARSTFATSASNRESLLGKLGSLPDRVALPASLLQELTIAWQASAQVDRYLRNWAQDESSGDCHPKKVLSDPNYQASLGPDKTASSHKAEFAQGWAPIARQYGLPAYSYDQI
jgi:hypothetical protein